MCYKNQASGHGRRDVLVSPIKWGRHFCWQTRQSDDFIFVKV